jgi:hypothetical protein
MKKAYISICLIILVLLIGCSNNKVKTPVDNNDFNKIKSELSHFPKKYNADTAVNDGCLVIVHGVLKSKRDVMDDFVSNSKSGKASSINIVQYTDEGDALITKVVYSNDKSDRHPLFGEFDRLLYIP